MSKYRCSIIIPLFNEEKEIEKKVKFLQKQNKNHDMEIILINDGSTDNSGIICEKLSEKYSNIIYLQQTNAGASSARNVGIRKARGKYLFFLDIDDMLTVGTIPFVLDFFDSIYNEVDLVTYPIETIYKGKKLQPHFRYLYLIEDGVYDLRENPYIGQTTMNIVVKNKFKNNILFDEQQTFSEDQKYCCDVLKNKLKMGFCNKGKYIYFRKLSSSSGRLAGSCYVFEQCIRFFEDLFEQYNEVPVAFQGLYVNDIYWKLISNMLYPYHYNQEEYDRAVGRIKKLLLKCSNDVILEHPQIDFFEKYYLLRLKDNNSIRYKVTNQGFSLWNGDRMTVYEQSMEIVVTKLQVKENQIRIDGFLKSVFFQFFDREVLLCAIENSGKITKKLVLNSSSHNYYLSHEETQKFLSFQYFGDIDEVEDVCFKVCLGKYWFPTHFYFMPLVSLSHIQKIYRCEKENVTIRLIDDEKFIFQKRIKSKDELWLYYDCVGVSKDNGLLQFEHDRKINDSVKRYYIVTDKLQKKFLNNKEWVKFGSRKHKRLLKECTKIITAYIEEANILPYRENEYEKISNEFDFEVIYLQHGVLHAVIPWKYSRERMMADKIVISTYEEKELYMSNGFAKKDLIETGMPRFELLNPKKKSSNRILFAPSWRQYLVGRYVDRKWELSEKKLLSSNYYRKTMEFLSSKELEDFLKEYEYFLEIKLHPIFKNYQHLFEIKSKYISMAETEVVENEYAIFLTDFSSYALNFEFLDIPVLHFIPDIEEFRCGMNGYRDLNYPKDFWNDVAISYKELIKQLVMVAEGQQVKKNVHFFEMSDNRSSIYKSIINNKIDRRGDYYKESDL